MQGKTQSILLQVAFKEAAAQGGTVAEIETRTTQFFELLTSLHTSLGINPDEGRATSGGRRRSGEVKELPAGAAVFALDGTQWVDYRTAKDSGAVKPRFPDFKTLDGKNSVWLVSPDGDPNEDAAPLVAAAQTAIF